MVGSSPCAPPSSFSHNPFFVDPPLPTPTALPCTSYPNSFLFPSSSGCPAPCPSYPLDVTHQAPPLELMSPPTDGSAHHEWGHFLDHSFSASSPAYPLPNSGSHAPPSSSHTPSSGSHELEARCDRPGSRNLEPGTSLVAAPVHYTR